MLNQHPITPPQELVLKWHVCAPRKHDDEGYVLVPPGHLDHIATQAAQNYHLKLLKSMGSRIV